MRERLVHSTRLVVVSAKSYVGVGVICIRVGVRLFC